MTTKSVRVGNFRNQNFWICMWAFITIGVRVIDTLMLFGVVKWNAIYITPVGITLLSNIISEVIFGLAFNITALVGALMLLIFPQDVNCA